MPIKDKERWERLAALGAKSEIETPEGEAKMSAVYVMDVIADRREKLFPSLRKIIMDYDVEISEGRLTMNVTSAPIPKLV